MIFVLFFLLVAAPIVVDNAAIFFMAIIAFSFVALHNYLYRRFWQEGLDIDMRFSTTEAFEGDKASLNQTITNKKFLPLPWVLMKYSISDNLMFEDTLEDAPELKYRRALFSVMMYQSVRRKLNFVCARRGFYRLRSVNVTCNNLLHTKHFIKDIPCYTELTVFPRILDDYEEFDIIYKTLDSALLSNSLINPDPFEFKGIREYSPTDPLRNINFKASAVAQELMVNIYAPTSSKSVEIILNVEYYSVYPNYELTEQAIRLAATVASRYIGQDVKVSFYTNGADTYHGNYIKINGGNSSAHLHSILEGLARLETVMRPRPMAAHLRDLQNSEVVYLIISCHHGSDFIEALQEMEYKGLDYVVVLAVEAGADTKSLETEKIKIWEAV